MAGNSYMPEGATPYVPEGATPVASSAPQSGAGPIEQSVGGEISKIPGVGGILQSLLAPSQRMADTSVQEQGPVSGPLFGLNVPSGMKTNVHALSQGGLPGLANSMAQTVPTQLGVAGVADLPGILGSKAALGAASKIGDVGSVIGGIAKYPTKSLVNKAMESAAAKATDAGKSIPWSDLSNNIRTAVVGKFGNSASVHKALENFLAEETPALQGEVKKGTQLADSLLNPTDLLKKRRTISTRISSPFFSKLAQALNPSGQSSAGQLDQSIANEARRVVSESLKGLAPDIKTPDKVYSLYSKVKGDVPTWGKRALGGYIVEQLFGNKLSGIPKDVVDGLGALLGGI